MGKTSKATVHAWMSRAYHSKWCSWSSRGQVPIIGCSLSAVACLAADGTGSPALTSQCPRYGPRPGSVWDGYPSPSWRSQQKKKEKRKRKKTKEKGIRHVRAHSPTHSTSTRAQTQNTPHPHPAHFLATRIILLTSLVLPGFLASCLVSSRLA